MYEVKEKEKSEKARGDKLDEYKLQVWSWNYVNMIPNSLIEDEKLKHFKSYISKQQNFCKNTMQKFLEIYTIPKNLKQK